MEERSELNDIILNKGGSAGNNKKVILAVATLGIILIVVVLLMNTISSEGTGNLPQASLPPQPVAAKAVNKVKKEPYFEDVEVVKEDQKYNTIEEVAEKIKAESKAEAKAKVKTPVVAKPKAAKKVLKKEVAVKKAKVQKRKKVKVATTSKGYFVQVGSFVKYKPNKKFLKSITSKGYSYRYYKVTRKGRTLNKVLVGPFKNEKEARAALKTIKKSIEHGAFMIRL